MYTRRDFLAHSAFAISATAVIQRTVSAERPAEIKRTTEMARDLDIDGSRLSISLPGGCGLATGIAL